MPLLRNMVEQALMTAGKVKEITEKSALSQEALALRRALTQSIGKDASTLSTSENEIIMPGVAENSSITEQYTFPQQNHFTTPEGANAPYSASSFGGSGGENLTNKFSRSRYLGAFINKFLLFEADRSLLIVDQHAAQERIVFEALIKQMERGKVEVQNLLTPDLLQVSMVEMLAWEESKEMLDQLGLTTTQFDKTTVAIHSCPALLSDPIRAVRELLAGGNINRADHATLARRACRASIRAGDPLKSAQAEFQKEQLLKCRDPFTCPHGRPTVIELKEAFLDRQFFRT